MTPRNPLDGKCIVDTGFLEMIADDYRNAFSSLMYQCKSGVINCTEFQFKVDQIKFLLEHLEKALDADLTGWAAVPVQPTDNMDVFATEDWLVQRALEDRASAIWQAMLAASPPLPGGGE